PLVEDDLEFEAELPNDVKRQLLVRFHGGHHDVPNEERIDSSVLERQDEGIGRPFGEQAEFAFPGSIDYGAVFGDDSIEDRKLGKNPNEVVDLPAGDQDQFSSAAGQSPQRLGRLGVDLDVMGQRAIVIRRDREI